MNYIAIAIAILGTTQQWYNNAPVYTTKHWTIRTDLKPSEANEAGRLLDAVYEAYRNGLSMLPKKVDDRMEAWVFLSKEDYLAQIEKQKRRLLTRIRTIYREERGVHDLIRSLDPSAEVFVQTCQLEAVRQDLIRERLGGIRNRIEVLVEDLAANNVSEEAESEALVELGTELQRIGDEHVGRAASLLRELAAVSDGAGDVRNPAAAIEMVNSSARELGLVVLQLGFAEASDVMARELHATAQTQAAVRLQTIVQGNAAGNGTEELAKAQTRLANASARLLAATPRNKESTSKDEIGRAHV